MKINTYHCSANNLSGPFCIHSAAGFVCRQGSTNLFKKLSNRNVSLHLILQRFNFASPEFWTRFEINYLDQTSPKCCRCSYSAGAVRLYYIKTDIIVVHRSYS